MDDAAHTGSARAGSPAAAPEAEGTEDTEDAGDAGEAEKTGEEDQEGDEDGDEEAAEVRDMTSTTKRSEFLRPDPPPGHTPRSGLPPNPAHACGQSPACGKPRHPPE